MNTTTQHNCQETLILGTINPSTHQMVKLIAATRKRRSVISATRTGRMEGSTERLINHTKTRLITAFTIYGL